MLSFFSSTVLTVCPVIEYTVKVYFFPVAFSIVRVPGLFEVTAMLRLGASFWGAWAIAQGTVSNNATDKIKEIIFDIIYRSSFCKVKK